MTVEAEGAACAEVPGGRAQGVFQELKEDGRSPMALDSSLGSHSDLFMSQLLPLELRFLCVSWGLCKVLLLTYYPSAWLAM